MRFLLAVAVLPFLVAAQTSTDNCRDDQGRDRCASTEQAKVRALFGVKPIEAHAAAGDKVRRVFYVDGYGRDLIAISAIRSRARSPEIRVDFPSDDQRISGPLTAPLPPSLWREIDARAASLTWTPPSPRKEPDAEIAICLHSWVFTLEAANPGVRRLTEDACHRGPGQTLAMWLMDATVAAFPHCAALDETKHRNGATLLRSCGILAGRDRVAAARVMNGMAAFDGVEGKQDVVRLAPYFASAVVIDWAGERLASTDAARLWATRMGSDDGKISRLYVDRVEGMDRNRVRLTGKLSRYVDTPRGPATGSEQAVVEQLWVRQSDGVFRMTRATVGPWRSPN